MKNIDEIKAIISSDSDMAEKINAMPQSALGGSDRLSGVLRIYYPENHTAARVPICQDWHI